MLGNFTTSYFLGDLVWSLFFQVFMTTTTINSQKQVEDFGNSDLKLKDIIKSLPKECFQRNRLKAWTGVLINVLMVCLGYFSLTITPWFLLPLAWIFTGTALTGFFVIAHDCGHRFICQTSLGK